MVKFFRTFARFVVIAGLSGVLPPGFARATVGDAAGLRPGSPSAAAVLAATIRHADASMFTRAGARADLTRGKHHRLQAALASAIGVVPPGFDAACVVHAAASTLCVSRSSATLRGPPART